MSNSIIFGLTLFSVLQKPSKKYVMHEKGYEEYVKALFSKERLDIKSDIFFDLSLPQLNRMDKTGCSYIHFLVYSKALPDEYKEKILAAEEKYAFLQALEVSDYESLDIKKIIAKETSDGSLFALFSLDDDDLLSLDYLQKLKRYIKEDLIGFNVVMSKGFTGFYDGSMSNVREVRLPFINIGQARICNKRRDGTVFLPAKGSHMKTDETCPTVIDSRVPTFFWFRHLVQDTFSKSEIKAARAKINNDLDNYSYPSESVLSKFPVLASYVKQNELLKIFSGGNYFLEKRKKSEVLFFEKTTYL